MNISITTVKKYIITILHRYHVIIFVVTVIGGLAVIVFFLNTILILSGEGDGYTSSINNATFDQSTIDRIKKLQTTTETQSQLDFSGRSNPFVE